MQAGVAGRGSLLREPEGQPRASTGGGGGGKVRRGSHSPAFRASVPEAGQLRQFGGQDLGVN